MRTSGSISIETSRGTKATSWREPRSALLFLALAALPGNGCVRDANQWNDCASADPGAVCAEDQPDTASTTPVTLDCASTGGTCVEQPPDGWLGPNLYWIGPIDAGPGSCPEEAPLKGAVAHADMAPVEHTCPTCACGPSETTCTPSTKWTIAAAKCPGEGAPQIPFDVLVDPWDGACNTDHALAADTMCEGDIPCAQSVTVQAPGATGGPCASLMEGKEKRQGPPWPWKTIAQECLVTPSDTCLQVEGHVCIPAPGEWLACISVDHGDHEEEIDCPSPFYDEKHVLYRDAEDTRACAPCACGDPAGGECAVQAIAYADGECTGLVAGSSLVFSSDDQACFDVSSGIALGSKSAEVKLTTPGTCSPSGGEAEGAVTPVRKVTLCCHHEEPR